MQSYKTSGNKDNLFKLFYLINGIFLLILINGIIFFIINGVSIPLWYYGLIILFAYFFYKIYRFFNDIKYEFTIEAIFIKFRKKNYKILSKDIDKIEKMINIPIVNMFALRYNPLSKELYYITSYQKIIKICLKNGEIIYISPRKFDEQTFNFYNNRKGKK